MKKQYNCPEMEVLKVNAMTALCESQFGDFNFGGGADTVDPGTDGL